MPYKEKEIEKLYWTISEVAKQMDVSPSLLRFWETEFTTIQPRKNKKGDRFYTKKDIDHLKTIYHLVKESGYTLKGAREKLKSGTDIQEGQMQTIETLKNIKEFLNQLKSQL